MAAFADPLEISCNALDRPCEFSPSDSAIKIFNPLTTNVPII